MNDAVDFSTKGSEYTKTYIELPKSIRKKNCKGETVYINLTPPRSGKTYIANLEQQLQAYKDKEDKLKYLIKDCKEEEEEVKEMLIALKNNWTIDFNKMEDMCDYCLETINQLQAYKDKEDKLMEDITTMNNYIKEIRSINESLQINAIHNKKVMDGVNWKIKRVKGYCTDNIYELTAFEGRQELEHILQILNEGE